MSRKYLQTSFSFDYGNRTPIKQVLLEVAKAYERMSTEISLMFFVNNIPYKLEFYLVLEVEEKYEKEFIEIQNKLSNYAIKELSIYTTRKLFSFMGDRRFDSLSITTGKVGIDLAFNLFRISERSEYKSKGYKFFDHNLYTDCVFFSYSNKKLVPIFETTINRLNADAFPVFFDQKSLFLGDELNDRLEDGIKDAKAIIFFIDKMFNVSEYCLKELELAKKYKKNILMIIDSDISMNTESLFIKLDFLNLDSIELYKIIREFLISQG